MCVWGVVKVYGCLHATIHTHSFLGLLPAYPTWTKESYYSVAWLPPFPTSALILSSVSLSSLKSHILSSF